MYFPDLSPYSYMGIEPDTYNVGWLDGAHPYSTGEVPEGFIKRLEAFLSATVHPSFGAHTCEICKKETWGDEIRVFGAGSTVYAVPTMIYHYIIDHHYLPPDEFIQAVFTSPIPSSEAYLVRARPYPWGASIERYHKRLAQLGE